MIMKKEIYNKIKSGCLESVWFNGEVAKLNNGYSIIAKGEIRGWVKGDYFGEQKDFTKFLNENGIKNDVQFRNANKLLERENSYYIVFRGYENDCEFETISQITIKRIINKIVKLYDNKKELKKFLDSIDVIRLENNYYKKFGF